MATSQNATIENVKDKVSAAGSKIRETGEKAMNEVSQRAEEVREKSDKGISTLGVKMSDFADTIREQAPESGSLGSAANAVADTLESSGEYLSEHGVGDIAADLGKVVRRYPMQSLFVGLGVGVLLGSAFSRK
ncbi:MAG: hypothetical protein J0M12_02880 [Deltaproteobacteria bacterium]|nr:hypothetical protein [Deltaproteobacteria bacterium]